MTYTPIPEGTPNWDVPVNAAFADQDSRISANTASAGAQAARVDRIVAKGDATVEAMGFLAIPYDPALATLATVIAPGTLYMIRLDIPTSATISSSTLCVVNSGVTLTAGQNLIGLYDASGTLLAQSADQSTAWASVGEKNANFTSPASVSAGTYYLAILSVGGTPPGFLRTVSSVSVINVINHNLTASTARWTTGPTSLTALPASVTMASRSLLSTALWCGIS